MKKIRIAALLLAASMLLATPAAAYTDVGGHWAEDYIAEVTERELFGGVEGDRFEPESLMSRAMAVTVLWRFAGRPDYESPHGFADSATKGWYSAALRWAKRCEIANGDEFGNFRPDAPIEREELVSLIFRYLTAEYPARFAGQMNTPEFYAASYLDHSTIHFADGWMAEQWASPALGWAMETGILAGDQNGLLRPRGYVTRAEAATIFCRVAALYEQK